MKKPTPAMKQALRALYEAGDGTVQARGVLAAGEWLRFDGKTWLRLAAADLVMISGSRIAPTQAGIDLAGTLPPYEAPEW